MRIRPAVERQNAARLEKRRLRRSEDRSPYSKEPALAAANIRLLEQYIRRNAAKLRTDKYTLTEIANHVLDALVQMPRPARLRAHMLFTFFTKRTSRVRSGQKTHCIEWQGAMRGGVPVVVTISSQAGERHIVDARKYALENPAKGPRRNFRSKPFSLCGNSRCVNPKHIEMRGLPREEKSGENHGRAKFSDALLRKVAREYNAGATAKELSKKYGIVLVYVEQIMRKEKRTEATAGMTIRGRFRSY